MAWREMRILNDTLRLTDLINICNDRLNHLFSCYLENIPAPELKAAIGYTLYNGGKRIRPLLIYATGYLFHASFENMDIPAAAVEFIHTYSLIHDDLPCMDDAELRRGKPSCHCAYGEGLAILTGDALHTLAMQTIACHHASLSAEKRVQMMGMLSKACGPYGMAAGQALDITLLNQPTLTADMLENIYQLKTGALLRACVQLGYLASTEQNESYLNSLTAFGELIGLAFQIQDDLLDIEATTSHLGKPLDMDARNQKRTYPVLHGLSAAKIKVDELYQSAITHIEPFGPRARLLKDLATLLLQRR